MLLVDGSPKCDEGIRNRCQELDVEYFHAGRETSYVESYNLGWRSLAEDHEYVGLMANDVLPHPTETIGRLRDQLALPDVGCTFPYLLTARQQEDETQRPGFLGRSRVTCEPASMTLNLNLFRREVLEAIGGLDEAYRGGYGEPILMLAIRKLGYRVVMVGGTQAYHYDRLTKLLGASSINDAAHDADSERWFRDYGKYASRRGIANLDFSRWPFATTTLARWMWRICYRLPGRKARKRVMRYGMWLEPFLTRYPARYGAKRR